MTAARRVKGRAAVPRLVAVIASAADLRTALALRRPPELFELRLDALYPVLPEAERFIEKLRAPLVMTARHPAEAGMNHLSPARRAELLLRFMPRAKYVDVELRSTAELRRVLDAAREARVSRIISLHDFRHTPSREQLDTLVESARRAEADIFKIVTRTDSDDDVARLLQLVTDNKPRLPLSVMATGKLGREARVALAGAGSVLSYVHLGSRQVEGQLSLAEMRRLLG